MRIELPGRIVSDYASTAVRKQIELIDAGPYCPRHVVDLFSIRRLPIFDEEIIEIPRDTDRHMQIFSVGLMQFRTRYDCVFNLFRSIHIQFLQAPIYGFFFALPDRLSCSQSFSVWSA